eukprot:c45522_g1_i1 orf=2-151(-)
MSRLLNPHSKANALFNSLQKNHKRKAKIDFLASNCTFCNPKLKPQEVLDK